MSWSPCVSFDIQLESRHFKGVNNLGWNILLSYDIFIVAKKWPLINDLCSIIAGCV
jgi:hypothetical protein